MDFHSNKPVVAIVGGFQIGKSTLVNCLLDDRYAPTGKGLRTTAASTLFRYGEAEEAWLFHGDSSHGERLARRQDVFDPSREVGPEDWFRISAWKPVLQYVDIVDTPGYNAQDDDDKSASAAIDASSVVVIVQAAKTMDELCRTIVREACVPGKRCLFLLNCANQECWAPDDPHNVEICGAIEAELTSMGVVEFFLNVGDRIVHPVNALWAWYATGQSSRDLQSPDESVRRNAERMERKIKNYAVDELGLEDPSPAELMSRCGFSSLRQRISDLGRPDGMSLWLDEAKNRASALYGMAAPVIGKAAEATTAAWRGTIVPNAHVAGEKAKIMAGRAWSEGSRLAESATQGVRDFLAKKGVQNSRKTIVPGAVSKMQGCAQFIENKYRATGHAVQIARIEDGGAEGMLVQIRNATTGSGRFFRTITGLTSCATLKLIPRDSGLEIEVMAGKWLDKIGAAAVSIVVLWPLLVTASIGAFRQKAMLDNLYAETLAWLSNQQ